MLYPRERPLRERNELEASGASVPPSSTSGAVASRSGVNGVRCERCVLEAGPGGPRKPGGGSGGARAPRQAPSPGRPELGAWRRLKVNGLGCAGLGDRWTGGPRMAEEEEEALLRSPLRGRRLSPGSIYLSSVYF